MIIGSLRDSSNKLNYFLKIFNESVNSGVLYIAVEQLHSSIIYNFIIGRRNYSQPACLKELIMFVSDIYIQELGFGQWQSLVYA